MRAIIYARVSTDDKEQNPDSQILKCKQYCELHNHEIIGVFKDEGISGDSNINERPEGNKAMKLLTSGKADCVIVFSVDRFSRESPIKVLQQLNYLKDSGITFISATEPVFNMESEFSEPMKYMLTWFSNYFLIQHIKKVKSGMERAKIKGTRSGKPIGRKRVKFDIERATQLRQQGMGWKKIAAELGNVSYITVRNYVIFSNKNPELHIN